MSVPIITLTTSNGEQVQFRDKIIATGGMKDVYASPDKRYVVAFYRAELDDAARQRLEMITGTYRERIFDNEQGAYWDQLYCWPTATVEHNGRMGVVAPFYRDHFFLSMDRSTTTCSKSRARIKKGSGSPHPITSSSSWMSVSAATGLITCSCVCGCLAPCVVSTLPG